MKNSNIILKNIMYPIIGMAIFFCIWAIGAYVYDNPLLLENPFVTLKAAFKLLTEGNFWLRIANSFFSSLISFCFSFIVALFLAIISVIFKIQKIFEPIITIIRSVPTMAIIILILLWTDAKTTPIIVAALITMPVLYSSFMVSLKGIQKELIETAEVFGCGRLKVIRYVFLPGLKRAIIEGWASGLSLSLKVVISAEIYASTKNSVGQFIKVANINLETANVLATAILVAFLCIIIEFLIRLLLKNKRLAQN